MTTTTDEYIPATVTVDGITVLADERWGFHLESNGIIRLEQLAGLRAGDVCGADVPVAESGSFLERMYATEVVRYNHGSQKGRFWEKVHQIAAILENAETWPFPPLEVGSGVLYDGHHRANAALLVGWDKPIPVHGDVTQEDESW